MTLRIAAFLCLAAALTAAEEHKAPAKPEPKAEAHKAESKEAPKKEAAGHTEKAEAKAEPKSEPKPEAKKEEPKPSALPSARPSSLRRPTRIAARPRVTREPAPAAAAPKPVPIVVEVKQEPARVEAVLRILPYNMPAYAASSNNPGFTAPNSAIVSPMPVGQYDTALGSNTTVAAFAPVNFAPSAKPEVQPRNTLRAPKNALTNEGLVILADAGYDEQFILDLMKMKNCHFDTTAEGLAYMATHGLTERIVKAALQMDLEQPAQLEARR